MKLFSKFMEAVDDRKTYMLVIAAVFTILSYSQGIISGEVLEMLLGLFGFGAIAALRHGVAKSSK